jgi:ribosomal protein S18 acetylase RimI-like enzyme
MQRLGAACRSTVKVCAVRVRSAVLDDVGQIAIVHTLGWQAEYRELLPKAVLDKLSTPNPISRLTTAVQQALWPGRGMLVADRDGQVVGFVEIRPTRDEDQDPARVGEIAALYVDPKEWRRRIGRSLVAAATERLAAAGCTGATLWVLNTNGRAIAFYNVVGFRPDGGVKPGLVGGMTTQNLRYRCQLVHQAVHDS